MTVSGWIARVVVYGSLLAAIALNAAVLISCDFLKVSSFPQGSLTIGLFTVSLLGSECYEYDSENIDTPIKTARVCSILTIVFGPLVLFLMLLDEFCRVPFADAFLSLGFLGAMVCSSLIWLIYRNQYCQLFGCDWGQAATLALCAQILYLVASLFSSYIDDKRRERGRQAQGQNDNN